ncbi:MAG: tRNA (adenosine(37)-N6)-threonylcarbamoyltransferase complex dimerization subunit type 1 TsaB [Erysipelotrichaceae bacterium]|nr:tRNA (adenosine(37)-N6)-threonylcarbamoyltransferase complex dimerization subunit type 1 TsaB [Erysipelotrichaceae bacterium]
MLTLCIDTAYKYLVLALIEDDHIISSYCEPCLKRQSEEVFVRMEELFRNSGKERKDIDSICITKGPGSYTGVRIAMSIAKVIGEVLPCDVYTISTLRLYASNNEKTMVLMDARAKRAYVGVYDKEECLLEDTTMYLDEIDIKDYSLVGDASLFDKEDSYPNLAEAFLMTKGSWEKVENIAYLTPEYLKESEKY